MSLFPVAVQIRVPLLILIHCSLVEYLMLSIYCPLYWPALISLAQYPLLSLGTNTLTSPVPIPAGTHSKAITTTPSVWTLTSVLIGQTVYRTVPVAPALAIVPMDYQQKPVTLSRVRFTDSLLIFY